MGTIPLFMPKMGIKTKLCSLKYAPRTAVAVVVKAIRILFRQKVITEPMEAMAMEGRPTE